MYQSIRSLLFGAMLLGLASLTSCQKSGVEPESARSTSIVGRWQLTASTNGMTGRTSPADPAQRRELVFTSAGQWTTLLNGAVVKTAPYSLVQHQSLLTKQIETYLVTDLGTTQLIQNVRVDATTLVLSFDAYDGPSATYQRERPGLCGTR